MNFDKCDMIECGGMLFRNMKNEEAFNRKVCDVCGRHRLTYNWDPIYFQMDSKLEIGNYIYIENKIIWAGNEGRRHVYDTATIVLNIKELYMDNCYKVRIHFVYYLNGDWEVWPGPIDLGVYDFKRGIYYEYGHY